MISWLGRDVWKIVPFLETGLFIFLFW